MLALCVEQHDFYFLLSRLPPRPRSTLFPYTTLFRSEKVMAGELLEFPHDKRLGSQSRRRQSWRGALRSEEHTSELQSLTNLVCRLLLEKKKPPPDAKIAPDPHSFGGAADAPSRHFRL